MEGNTVYTCAFTSDETKAIQKFKDHLTSKKIEYNSKKINDEYLVRFLRARKLDINKTFEMFVKFLAWRKENDIDNIDVKYNIIN
jgi:hypothetical protein